MFRYGRLRFRQFIMFGILGLRNVHKPYLGQELAEVADLNLKGFDLFLHCFLTGGVPI